MSSIAIFVIRVYQKTLSKLLRRMGVRCRFYPTCSQYAILAIQKHGLHIGLKKTWLRLKRCRPDNLESCMDYP